MTKKKKIIVAAVIITLLLLLFLFWLAGNTEPEQPWFPSGLPTTEESCKAVGGNWSTLGMYGEKTGEKVCNPPTTDGGKVCYDKKDCQGVCLVNHYDVGLGRGRCSDHLIVWGCYSWLSNHKVHQICID